MSSGIVLGGVHETIDTEGYYGKCINHTHATILKYKIMSPDFQQPEFPNFKDLLWQIQKATKAGCTFIKDFMDIMDRFTMGNVVWREIGNY